METKELKILAEELRKVASHSAYDEVQEKMASLVRGEIDFIKSNFNMEKVAKFQSIVDKSGLLDESIDSFLTMDKVAGFING